jgi:hypothetical protein
VVSGRRVSVEPAWRWSVTGSPGAPWAERVPSA